jgi:hypothetical protein
MAPMMCLIADFRKEISNFRFDRNGGGQVPRTNALQVEPSYGKWFATQQNHPAVVSYIRQILHQAAIETMQHDHADDELRAKHGP